MGTKALGSLLFILHGPNCHDNLYKLFVILAVFGITMDLSYLFFERIQSTTEASAYHLNIVLNPINSCLVVA